mgnify:CR=1 FL=1
MRRSFLYIITVFLLLGIELNGQERFDNETRVNRILFILDASGSMKTEWDGSDRFQIATDLLAKVVDSIERVDRKVEFALRVYGHQSHRSLKNCQDSRLEVPFKKYNSANVTSKLESLTPQGHTPIAFSIFQSLNDFPNDPYSKNAIVLITDGLENCGGDICALGLELEKRHITMRPFIIGMGLDSTEQSSFSCIGTYLDAGSKQGFKEALDIVISQARKNTTTHVNLIKADGKPNETNVEMSFYNSHSDEIRYNLLHTLDKSGLPDTLFLNPLGKYDLEVHSLPPVQKDDIRLNPGKHNIIGVDLPMGSLRLGWSKIELQSNVQCLVRQHGVDSTLHIQDLNTSMRYLTGKYDLEFLTVPRRIYEGVELKQSKTTDVKLPNQGKLRIVSAEPGLASIYEKNKLGRYEKVYDFYLMEKRELLEILPGKYMIVYKPKSSYDCEMTVKRYINVGSNAMVSVNL